MNTNLRSKHGRQTIALLSSLEICCKCLRMQTRMISYLATMKGQKICWLIQYRYLGPKFHTEQQQLLLSQALQKTKPGWTMILTLGYSALSTGKLKIINFTNHSKKIFNRIAKFELVWIWVGMQFKEALLIKHQSHFNLSLILKTWNCCFEFQSMLACFPRQQHLKCKVMSRNIQPINFFFWRGRCQLQFGFWYCIQKSSRSLGGQQPPCLQIILHLGFGWLKSLNMPEAIFRRFLRECQIQSHHKTGRFLRWIREMNQRKMCMAVG